MFFPLIAKEMITFKRKYSDSLIFSAFTVVKEYCNVIFFLVRKYLKIIYNDSPVKNYCRHIFCTSRI